MGSDEEVVDQICEFVNWLPWEIVFFFKYQPTIRSSQIYIVRLKLVSQSQYHTKYRKGQNP